MGEYVNSIYHFKCSGKKFGPHRLLPACNSPCKKGGLNWLIYLDRGYINCFFSVWKYQKISCLFWKNSVSHSDEPDIRNNNLNCRSLFYQEKAIGDFHIKNYDAISGRAAHARILIMCCSSNFYLHQFFYEWNIGGKSRIHLQFQ